jgi:hypothetical protein
VVWGVRDGRDAAQGINTYLAGSFGRANKAPQALVEV